MYAIVLAGGYAKRLWPLTIGVPKALLPIAGKPLLDYIVEKLQALNPPLSRIVLSTNMLFQPQFKDWLDKRCYKNIEIIPDDSSCEAEKPGAIKAMANIIRKMPEEDVFVIAGDGMFTEDLTGLLKAFMEKNMSVVAIYNVPTFEDAARCATVKVGLDGRVLDFIEKPSEPKTKTVCGAVYIFPKRVNQQLNEYLSSGLPTDQPGRFVEWLYRQEPVYGYMLSDPLWDIGTHEAYKACDEYFRKHLRNVAK